MLTCDTAGVAPDRGAWGLSLTKQGKIVSDLVLVASADAIYSSAAPNRTAELLSHLDRMLVMEDAEIADRSAELGFLFLHGPKATELARDEGAIALGAVDLTGLGGAAVVVRRTDAREVLERLTNAGAVVGSAEDWERLRVERRVPRFGVDFDAGDNPHDASLAERAVCWTKGCYLGQEVVYMQNARGKTKRSVITLRLSADATPGMAVNAPGHDAAVGELTTVANSAVAGQLLALARVSAAFAEPKTRLLVAGAEAEVLAEPV